MQDSSRETSGAGDGGTGAPGLVSICRPLAAGYPAEQPFDPHVEHPEYPWSGRVSTGANQAYEAVRDSLAALGLDPSGLGTPSWNPLGGLVRPGDTVLLKPNLVSQCRDGMPGEWVQIVTSASVVRAVLDFVLIALGGRGRVAVADAPQTDTDFQALAELTGLGAMVRTMRDRSGMEIDLLDLRSERWIVERGICTGSEPLAGDPCGTVEIDLGAASRFAGTTGSPFYGAGYDSEETNRHHSGGRHEYDICRTALAADVIVSIPKLKTHKKCGMTGCLKGMVGLAGNKNLLPHYRFGSPSQGGDQYPDSRRSGRLESALVHRAKKVLASGGAPARDLAGHLKPLAYRIFGSTSSTIRSGNWHGNDTIWRTVLDLAAILTYADRDGVMGSSPARRFFCVVDGIIGGEGNGPLDADARGSRLVVAGESPLLVDAVSARAIGMDPFLVPLVKHAFEDGLPPAPCRPEEIEIRLEPDGLTCTGLGSLGTVERFTPHFGWRNASPVD
jgi:uncharacterized protein (DUF362 family)